MSGIFREAGPADFADVLRLYRQLHPSDVVLTDGSDHAVFEVITAADHLHLFVLEQSQAVVATTYLNVIANLTRSAAPYGVIENVVVEQAQRGTGLGKQIMAQTLDGLCRAPLNLSGRRGPAHDLRRTIENRFG